MNEFQLFKESLKLLYQYNTNGGFKEQLDKAVLSGQLVFYQNRPLMFYINLLIVHSDLYRYFYLKLANKPFKIKSFYEKPTTIVSEFLEDCYHSGEAEFKTLVTLPPQAFYNYLSPQELQKLYDAGAFGDTPQMNNQYSQVMQGVSSIAKLFEEKIPEEKSIEEVALKITKVENISNKDKAKAAFLLKQKVKQYSKQLADRTQRQGLIDKKLFTEGEINKVLQAGLVKASDITPTVDPARLQNRWERSKVLKEVAVNILTEQVKVQTEVKQVIKEADQDIKKAQKASTEAKKVIEQARKTTTSTLNTPKSPSFISSSLSRVKAQTSQGIKAVGSFIGKHPSIGVSAVSGAIGGVVGTTFGPSGTLGGIFFGGAFPQALKVPEVRGFINNLGNNVLNLGSNLGRGNITGGGRILGGLRGGATIAKAAPFLSSPALIIISVLGALTLFMVFQQTAETAALLPPYQSLSEGSPEERPEPALTPFPGGGGENCLNQTEINANKKEGSCKYFNPGIDIFNTSISQEAINSYINKYSPIFTNARRGDLAEFTKRVNYIVNRSQEAKLNPVIFLGYWRTESLFSTVGTRDMGCVGSGFYEQVDCSLGIGLFSDPAKNPIANCARSGDANSIACKSLKGLRNQYDKTYPINYPIRSFDNFAESYGPYDHLNERGEHSNCNHTYNLLLEMANELGACTPKNVPRGYVSSCPIPNSQIICGSYGKPESWGGYFGICRTDSTGNGGHCNQNYVKNVGICANLKDSKGELIRTAKSIDLASRGGSKAGDPIFLPTIKGQAIKWYYKGVISAGSNFGWIRLFQSEKTSEGIWSLHLVHANQEQPPLAINQSLNSGDIGATMFNLGDGIHIHVTIGLNVGDSVSDLKDYSPNWLFADRDLKMCVN